MSPDLFINENGVQVYFDLNGVYLKYRYSNDFSLELFFKSLQMIYNSLGVRSLSEITPGRLLVFTM